MRYLVTHDADAIQQYVFATSRLREIRGASALLDQINRIDTSQLTTQHNGELIFCGGGAVAADFADIESARAFCQALSDQYLKRTITASSTGVITGYDETAPDTDPNSFTSALKQAHYHLRHEKASRGRTTQALSSPYFKRCQACGIYPAVEMLSDPGGGERFICSSCRCKHSQQSRDTRVQQLIRRRLRRKRNVQIKFPRELDEIGGAAHPQGYIGVIYADGNRIGDRLLQIKSKSALRGFSESIDKAARQAIAKVLINRWKPDPENRLLFPALVPLCGGDDLVVIVQGQQAIEVAAEYLEEFQERMRQILPRDVEKMIFGREVSACAGVAIGKAHVPLSSLLDLAESLCGSAKKRYYDLFQKTGKEEPCIDFQVVTTPNWQEAEVTRSGQLLPSANRRLTCRPYTVEEVQALIGAVKALKNTGFPPGKLHDLYRSFWLGKFQASLKYLMMYMRARPDQQSALSQVQKFLRVTSPPWRIWEGRSLALETPYADLVEIYQFIEEMGR